MGLQLPVHDEFSRGRRIFSGVSILVAFTLLIWQSYRLAAVVESSEWWLVLVVIAGVAAADLFSGVVHWAADTWGRESMPVVGRRLLHPFRVHHVNPDDFLRRRFLDTNGDTAFLVVVFILPSVALPLEASWQRAVIAFLIGFGGVGLLTNQMHQWAHMRQPPQLVRFLQRAGFLLRHEVHQEHHRAPHTVNYCIATGWWNPILETLSFFRRAESLVTTLTGAKPRGDEAAFFSAVVHSTSERARDQQCRDQSE